MLWGRAIRHTEPRPRGSGPRGISLHSRATVPGCTAMNQVPWTGITICPEALCWVPTRIAPHPSVKRWRSRPICWIGRAGKPFCRLCGGTAPRLESAGRACADEPRPCDRGSRCSAGESDERIQVVRQPGAQPPGLGRTGSKAMGTPRKHTMAVEGRGRSAGSAIRRRPAGNPWLSLLQKCYKSPLPRGRGSVRNNNARVLPSSRP
jgi:hypothetical protein